EMFIDGKMCSVNAPAALSYLEKNCALADKASAAACPFYDPMYLTRADGTIGIIYPATDTCNIIRTASGFYKYKGTSQDFWALFGNWLELL
ncbi:MAG: hypothetical protein HFH30_01705, partial [Eubacterium sp.]|nr:hypothetical protein [Eubacterium sp.]